MNKRLTIIVIAMFILIVAVIAIFVSLIANKNKNNNTSYNNITEEEKQSLEYRLDEPESNLYVSAADQIDYSKENLLHPENMEKAFEGYKGTASIYKIKAVLYKLIIDNSYKIYLDIKDLSDDSIRSYYYNNYDQYKAFQIKSADDFVEISKQIKSAFEKPNYHYSHSFVDIRTIKDVDNYREYVVVVSTNAGAYIRIKIIMSNNSSSFIIENYDEFEYVYEKYAGVVRKEEIKETLNNYVQKNANEIYSDTRRKTDNEVLQMYDTNKETINAMGIYSKEDYLYMARQTVLVRWNYHPETFIRLEIGNCVNDGEYSSYLIRLLYSDNHEMVFKLCLANSVNSNPRMKLAKVDNVDTEEDTNEQL